jgi:serine/threonine protein kinase/regulator of sirC expression with transglutaminase-like and TPR domain
MFDLIRKAFGHSPRRHRRGHHVEEEFTQRNPPAKLPPVRSDQPRREAALAFAKGDKIGGIFQIYGVLGQGGFGTVLLVYDLEAGEICALKTFRDELLANAEARTAFQREASRWVDIGEHPFILTARSVRQVSNRLYVKMDSVPHDEEGRSTLAHYLSGRTQRPVTLEEQLEWGIQFCLGMEHANQHGIICHRDIKPQNILITANKSLKISDFGLALVAEASPRMNVPVPASAPVPGEQPFSLSVINARGKRICGTPGYIPPEIYRSEPGDTRSDIYSFGLVLWQMAAQSPTPPFSGYLRGDLDAYLRAVYETQMTGNTPPVDGPMQPIIARCTDKDPEKRYQTFTELREELEAILWREVAKTVEVPDKTEATTDSLYQRAISLCNVQRFEEGLAVLDRAIQAAPQNVVLRANRAACLSALGRTIEALQCCDEALQINPQHPYVAFHKACVLAKFGQHVAALICYEQILAKMPKYYLAWKGKSDCLIKMGRFEEALACCDRVLELQPKAPGSWGDKAAVLGRLNRAHEGLACCDRALACDPQYTNAWVNKSIFLSRLKQLSEATRCVERALDIDPGLSTAWAQKGEMLHLQKRNSEAVACYAQALALDPGYATMWYNQGIAQEILRHFPEAISCLSKFLETARPQDARYIPAAQAKLRRLKMRAGRA